MKNCQISIVIPVYNNATTLVELENQIRETLDKYNISFEIIFINDFSKDNSYTVVKELSKKGNIDYINNIRNIGQHKSILKGIKISKGNTILVMDADLQDKPCYIPHLYKSLDSSCDAVFALRSGKYQNTKKLITSKIFKSISEFLSGLDKKAGTYFIIKEHLKIKLLNLNCKYVYSTFMVACVAKRIKYIYVKRDLRKSGRSQYSTYKRIKAGFLGLASIIECKVKILTQKI